jgi:hypothetical protein
MITAILGKELRTEGNDDHRTVYHYDFAGSSGRSAGAPDQNALDERIA